MPEKITLQDVADRAVISIPESGELLGLGRSSAYAAAVRGELPVLVIGRRKVVPVAALLKLLGISATELARTPAPSHDTEERA